MFGTRFSFSLRFPPAEESVHQKGFSVVTQVLMSHSTVVSFFFPPFLSQKLLSSFTVIFAVSVGYIQAVMLDFSCASSKILLPGHI